MASWEQMKAYMQNPDVAMKELMAKKRGAEADMDQDLKEMSIKDAEQTKAMAPGSNPDPMAMYKNMEAAQGLASVGGISKVGAAIAESPVAQQALQKLAAQAKTGAFTNAGEAALFNKLTGKVVPVDNAAMQLEALKKLRGY